MGDPRTRGLKFKKVRMREGGVSFDVRLMLDGNEEELREYWWKCGKSQGERARILAVMMSVMGEKEVGEKLKITPRYIRKCWRWNKEIGNAALIARNLTLVELAERKAYELIRKMDVEKIDDKDKAKSARFMADIASMQLGQMNQMMERARGGGGEETEELIYRIKRKVVKGGGEKVGEAIDITSEIREEKKP